MKRKQRGRLSGWVGGVHDDLRLVAREAAPVMHSRETPSNPKTMEVLGNDQGTRGLREGRGNGCLG